MRRPAAALLLLCSAACAGDSTGGPTGGPTGRAPGSGEDGGGGGGEGEGDGAPDGAAPDPWSPPEIVATGAMGNEIRLVSMPDGAPAVAWFRPTGADLPCQLTAGQPFFEVTRRQYDIVWSAAGPDGAWRDAVVAQTDIVHGLGVAAVPASGAIHLAFLGGEPGTQWCAGSDLMLASGDGAGFGAPVTVQAGSGTGAQCKKMQNVCNVGNVTGLWATLGASPAGDRVAVAFQDIHFGFAKEDWESADMEIAFGPGGWAAQTVYDSDGGGKWAAVALGDDGGTGVAWYNERHGGVWFALEGAGDDGGWPAEPVKVSSAEPTYPLQLVRSPAGFALAYNDTRDGQRGLYYATSPDGSAWAEEVVDQDGATGTSPSLRLDSAGRPLIAYGRCGEANDQGCDPQRDGIWLARRDDRRWRREAVPGGGESDVREGAAVALTLAGDLPVVAFVRERFDPATQEARTELRVVRGR